MLGLDVSAGGSARAAGLDTSDVLQGEVVNGKACFWITTRDGRELTLVWPPGSVAKENPLRVEDRTGNVLAAVGTRGTQISGHPEPGAGCRPGSARFVVGDVSP